MSDFIHDRVNVRLLNDWQRDLPLVSRPFSALARALDIEENDVIKRLTRLRSAGLISRVGGAVRPNIVGASTLAAMSVPDLQIEDVARLVSSEPGVNHSYLRENDVNLWFVATGPDREHVTNLLMRIEQRTGMRVLDLRLERAYHIDLGFPLDGRKGKVREAADARAQSAAFEHKPCDTELLQAMTRGLALVPRPFQSLAQALGLTEERVIERMKQLCAAGTLTRVGVIVRHRSLGWRSNAMVVWDVDPGDTDRVGNMLADVAGVNLCYRRTRFEAEWPFNLYCMVHAKSRADALETIALATETAQLQNNPRQILFSNRCFKQTGAMLVEPQEAA